MRTRTKRTWVAVALAFVPLVGCAAKRVALARLPPPCAFSIDGDRILCGSTPYAEIVRRECGSDTRCRGLGIRYADGSKVTLYAAHDFDPWAPGHYKPRSKGEFIADWAHDIGFDARSRRVTFRTSSFFSSARWAYDVATGWRIKVD